MTGLIDLGVRQGIVLAISEQAQPGSEELSRVEKIIKQGRYGLFQNKAVNQKHLYVVLTQDCSISSGKYIELAQMKAKAVADESRVEHLLLGKDYGKLFLKYDGSIYEVEESLLTKIKTSDLVELVSSGLFNVNNQLDVNEKRIIIDWRLRSYLREPYPDGFNRSLFRYLEENSWFTDYLHEHREHIHSLRIYVSPEDIENAECYCFSITAVLYIGGEQYEKDISDKLETMIKGISQFDNIKCMQDDNFEFDSVELPEYITLAFAVSLDDFSFANADVMREFNFQYLCY
ncbi:hypothetical protein [uncultured Ferrimonas sp.]|uniref:hypothetical protein n=1 Tax=uncultured Ferrimonas sp. TaxID=432640 RepID=UPI00262A5595|nr:hypothetical protein [uncultured Ferrimonas sp.]